MKLCRQPGPIPVRSTYFRSWDALAGELDVPRAELPARCVFSDLHLGAWKGHWIGRELCSQLGVPFPGQRQPRLGLRPDEIDEGRYIGALTDNEGAGDFNTLMALQIATATLEAIKARGIRWIVVLAPAAPRTWGRENLLLLDFLAQGCRAAGCDLLLVFAAADARAPARWDQRWLGTQPAAPGPRTPGQLAAIPGLIPKRFVDGAHSSADVVHLSDGRLVLSPLARKRPDDPARACLAEFLDGPGSLEYQWLAAYAFCDDVPDDAEVEILFASAKDRSAEGGDDVVLDLLEQGKRKTTDRQLLGWADGQRQNAVLRLRRWEEAAAGPLPDDALHPSLKIVLHHDKALGLVMTNRAAEAEPHFKATRDLCSDQQDSKFYLYLLNVSALNKLRLGQAEEAFELEKIIERRLADERITDWHATYINTINQARLYKRTNDLVTSEAYYRRAFAITDGVRSESDLLYTCLCFAQLEERKGRHDAALLLWLRGAIHWLSNPAPEALAPRVVEAVLAGPRADFVDGVSAALQGFLGAAWAKSGRERVEVDEAGPAPSFGRIDEATAAEVRCALGMEGWTVFVTGAAPSPTYLSPAYSSLARRVWLLLRRLAPHDELPASCALYTDAQLGSDLPVTEEQALGSAIRHGVRTAIFAGRRIEVDVTALERARVALAPAVATLDSAGPSLTANFKRYLGPLALAPHEAELVRSLTPDSTVASVVARLAGTRTRAQSLATLRGLESRRVVWIGLGERAPHPAMELVCSLATLVVHAPAYFGGVPPTPPADEELRISRFAYLRHERELVLHSPRAHAHLVVLGPDALRVYHALCGGSSLAALVRQFEGSLPAAELAVFVRLALAAGIAVRGDEDADPALRTWQFHDLLLQAESRWGRNTGPLGGTFRFARGLPPPAVKEPSWGGETIALAVPAADDPYAAATLEEVLARRATVRTQGKTAITVRQLGELLYRTARILTRTDEPWPREFPLGGEYTRRPYPNGGSRYELELYVTANRCDGLARGVYYYDALNHRLATVSGPNPDVEQLLREASRASGALDPQLLVTIASRFPRCSWKYQGLALSLQLKNLGVLYAHLYLVATAMKLAPCALGAGNSDLFCRIAKTDYLAESSIGEFLLGST